MIVIVYAVLILTMDKPPIAEFKSCQGILSKAKRVNADVYSPEYYNAAEKKYQAALIEWKIQNEKVFFSRDYSRSKELILTAILKAQEANASSGHSVRCRASSASRPGVVQINKVLRPSQHLPFSPEVKNEVVG